MTNNVSPSEAIYGFAAWLTTREDSVTFGAGHGAAEPARLVNEYCKKQGFDEPRNGIYPGNLVG